LNGGRRKAIGYIGEDGIASMGPPSLNGGHKKPWVR